MAAVLDPYLVGEPFHRPPEQAGHGLDEAGVVGDPGEHLLLACGPLNAARQRAAPGGLIAVGIENLEVPGRPAGQGLGDLHGAPPRRLDQIPGDQFLDQTVALFPILPQVGFRRQNHGSILAFDSVGTPLIVRRWLSLEVPPSLGDETKACRLRDGPKGFQQ